MNRMRRLFMKRLFSMLLCISLVFSNAASYGFEILLFEDPQNDLNFFHIRQQAFVLDGTYIARPNPLDENIANFIFLNNIQSLEDYAQWLKDNFKYVRADEAEVWLNPEEIIEKGQGDCDDFALLTSAVARVLGFQPQFIALIKPDDAHAICAFKLKDNYVWFDNDELKITGARTYEDFQRHIIENYEYSQLVELDVEKDNHLPEGAVSLEEAVQKRI